MDEVSAFRRHLLDWYDANRRDLPWRTPPGELPDPYRIWVSEVMLQQTRVETVRPYFERWMSRFPDLETLAAAPRDDVLKAWEGLGYYSRARNLHQAVREVVDLYGAVVPDDPSRFRELPGVGAYTAGAVMSIAYGLPEPVVDGNVRRVFARVRDQAEPSNRTLWSLARTLASGQRPGDLNQALMELGATICTPRAPRCDECPVYRDCEAFRQGTVAERPAVRRRAPLPIERYAAAAVESNGHFLLVRRPERGRLGGLWEFPATLVTAGAKPEESAATAARSVCGQSVSVVAELGEVSHFFTHVRVIYNAYLMRLGSTPRVDSGSPGMAEWVPLERIGTYALPRAQQRIATLATTCVPDIGL